MATIYSNCNRYLCIDKLYQSVFMNAVVNQLMYNLHVMTAVTSCPKMTFNPLRGFQFGKRSRTGVVWVNRNIAYTDHFYAFRRHAMSEAI